MRRFFRNEQHWNDISFFREVSMFDGLSAGQLGRIKQAMQKRNYKAGELLFTEGQIGKAVFLIKSGKVELTRGAHSTPHRLGVLEPRQLFGEMALLEQLPRTANARVIEDGTIYLLYTSTLESLVRRHPAIGIKIMKNMAIMLSSLLRKANKQMDKNGKNGN